MGCQARSQGQVAADGATGEVGQQGLLVQAGRSERVDPSGHRLAPRAPNDGGAEDDERQVPLRRSRICSAIDFVNVYVFGKPYCLSMRSDASGITAGSWARMNLHMSSASKLRG